MGLKDKLTKAPTPLTLVLAEKTTVTKVKGTTPDLVSGAESALMKGLSQKFPGEKVKVLAVCKEGILFLKGEVKFISGYTVAYDGQVSLADVHASNSQSVFLLVHQIVTAIADEVYKYEVQPKTKPKNWTLVGEAAHYGNHIPYDVVSITPILEPVAPPEKKVTVGSALLLKLVPKKRIT